MLAAKREVARGAAQHDSQHMVRMALAAIKEAWAVSLAALHLVRAKPEASVQP
jgi:hypothetical protein